MALEGNTYPEAIQRDRKKRAIKNMYLTHLYILTASVFIIYGKYLI